MIKRSFIMYYYGFKVVLQEVPGEISLCFSISGCPLRCKGCHSPFLWKEGAGTKMTADGYADILHRYFGFATCVVFMGGEWHPEELIAHLKMARERGYKTCLYTGKEQVNARLLEQLTWVKTGSWRSELGGLRSATTNQKFIDVKNNKISNHLFIQN